MRPFITAFLAFFTLVLVNANSISGTVHNEQGDAVPFANVILYAQSDSSMYKGSFTNEEGFFNFINVVEGNYFLEVLYIGLDDLKIEAIEVKAGIQSELGTLIMNASSTELATATVKASRALIEVKPDRTVFNVEGTINSSGSDALALLRKAPSVVVDNNDNITVLGRTGVQIYIDGKPSPLSGADLTAYLQTISAEQIDRLDIITNPGAKYDAEGNAGIIDIILKKNKNHGANGSLSSTFGQGRYASYNSNLNGNYRNQHFNVFGSLGVGMRNSYFSMLTEGTQNGLFLDEVLYTKWDRDNYDLKLGTDYFINEKNTIGFLINGSIGDQNNSTSDNLEISRVDNNGIIDSVLIATNENDGDMITQQYNLNYRYFNKESDRSINIDLDYGEFNTKRESFQPNQYFNDARDVLLSESIVEFDTPSDIAIYTFKTDYETPLAGGKFGTGIKLSQVTSYNTFLVYDVMDGAAIRNDLRSNIFDYDETVYAAYLSYNRPINDSWSFLAGLRAEQTDVEGILTPFDSTKLEDPVVSEYLKWFPSAGLTWKLNPKNTLSFSYGRRINRPDYQVLNPFESQSSELSFEKGNPFLLPEIVNNFEIGYTLNYRYNFKLGYNKIDDQITRLIGPDDEDPRAGFFSWENLAERTVWSFNASIPLGITKWWSAYINASASHLDNQADYGANGKVDIQAFTYSIYQQHTFNLPWNLKGELSGYYSGPGVWGGVYLYDANGSMDIGLQRKFIQDKLNVKLSFSDIFKTQGFNGGSEFNGLVTKSRGRWDSRRFTISLSYNFGNSNVKSRKRKTGLEDEAGRVGSGGQQG